MSAEDATIDKMESEDATSSQKKELSPEAESISRVLVNCISQVKLALSLPAILQIYSKSGDLDQDLNRLLQAHQVLIEKLEKLEGQQQRQTKEEKRKMVQLQNAVKDSVRDILRYFRTHPAVFSHLKTEHNVEVGESESMLIGTLEKFHSQIVENLLSGPDENPCGVFQQQSCPDCVMPRVEEDLKQLEEELEEKILDKQTEIERFQRYLGLPDKQEEKQDEASSKLTSLNQEIFQLEAQLNNLMLENRQAQRILQEENELLEMEIESLLQTFDKDMEKLQAELDIVEKKHRDEQEEVTKLQGPLSLLEAQINMIQERKRLEEEKRKEENRVLELKSKAAVVIQAWWRGYSIRKALKNKSKGIKGKKGKKGKSRKNK